MREALPRIPRHITRAHVVKPSKTKTSDEASDVQHVGQDQVRVSTSSSTPLIHVRTSKPDKVRRIVVGKHSRIDEPVYERL